MAREKQINIGNNESVLSKIDIREGQRFIVDQFLHFYTKHGYQSLPSASLLPQDDRSVLFTGATITSLKKFVEEGVPTPGICMVQKCLRTKRMDEMTNLDIIPDWTHYFTMCGILSAPGRTESVSNEAFELLINQLKIRQDNLLIEASSADRDLSNFWSKKRVIVVEDTQPGSYYRWQYGLPNIFGRGINLLLRFDQNSSYRDLGNVISIEDNTGKVIAYEFGFGLESLLSKMYGFERPMEASLVSSVIPYKKDLQEKFIDVLMAAVVIYHYGVEPGRGRERHVLKRLVKGLSFLRRKMDLPVEQIAHWSGKFEEVEFGTSDSKDKLISGIILYESQLTKFIGYAKNQVHAHRLKNNVGERLLVKLKRRGVDMGILTVEIEEVIENILG